MDFIGQDPTKRLAKSLGCEKRTDGENLYKPHCRARDVLLVLAAFPAWKVRLIRKPRRTK
jgi:hypothetical protein